MTEHGDDCLHCMLWVVINKFCAEYPDGCVHDVLIAVADVIGDLLAIKSLPPQRNELIREINKDILKRIKYIRKQMRKENARG